MVYYAEIELQDLGNSCLTVLATVEYDVCWGDPGYWRNANGDGCPPEPAYINRKKLADLIAVNANDEEIPLREDWERWLRQWVWNRLCNTPDFDDELIDRAVAQDYD